MSVNSEQSFIDQGSLGCLICGGSRMRFDWAEFHHDRQVPGVALHFNCQECGKDQQLTFSYTDKERTFIAWCIKATEKEKSRDVA